MSSKPIKINAKTDEERMDDMEARIEALEQKGAAWDTIKTWYKEGKMPSQEEMRMWIKDNPFLAMGMAILATALIIGIIG